MKKHPLLLHVPAILAGILLMLLYSCENTHSGKPRSTGKVNELLVVTGSKEAWYGPLGDTIRDFFGGQMVGVPQPEPIFDILNIPDQALNDLFKKHHNIFIVDIGPSYATTTSETKEDLWAIPQRVIKVTAPDTASFYAEFDRKKASFMKLFEQLEIHRTISINQMANDVQIIGQIEKKFGISLNIPGSFYIAEDGPDFAWLRHSMHKTRGDVELGILIYSTDYTDTAIFSPGYIIQWRNTITRQHIPGPSPDSYMKVADEVIPPVFTRTNDFPAGYAVITRGLWDVENDFMGGSFINITFLDEKTNKVISLDGYVYNPNESKKEYLRQLESIFYTAKLTGKP